MIFFDLVSSLSLIKSMLIRMLRLGESLKASGSRSLLQDGQDIGC